MWWQLLLLVVACGQPDPLSPADACDDIGVAIAYRSFTCGASQEASNQRYEHYQRVVSCNIGDTDVFGAYGCHRAIRDLPCDSARAYGDDLAQWLFQGACASFVDVPGLDGCTTYRSVGTVYDDLASDAQVTWRVRTGWYQASPLHAYSVKGGPRFTFVAQALAQVSDDGRIEVALKLNDPDTLDLFPTAVNSVELGWSLQAMVF